MTKTVKQVVKGIAVLTAVVVVYLTLITLGPGFDISAPLLKEDKAVTAITAPLTFRNDVSFQVQGSRVSAFLYLPEDSSGPVPAVVMAHGLGGTRDFILENYATPMRNAGIAVLTFDYRFMGVSEGRPRQLVWLPYQLEDVESAIEYARSRSELDPERVAVWGTSTTGRVANAIRINWSQVLHS